MDDLAYKFTNLVYEVLAGEVLAGIFACGFDGEKICLQTN